LIFRRNDTGDRQIVFRTCKKPTSVDSAEKKNSCPSGEYKKADFKYVLNRIEILRNAHARGNKKPNTRWRNSGI
jgi:hypothetical protein